MKHIAGVQADPLTVALISTAFGRALSDNLAISPHQEEKNAEGMMAAAAILDYLVDHIVETDEWEGVFSADAFYLGDWMAEHYNQHGTLPDTEDFIEQATLVACANSSDHDVRCRIGEQAVTLSALINGSDFSMPSAQVIASEIPPYDEAFYFMEFSEAIRANYPNVEVEPIAIDLRFSNEIPDGKSRMAWFKVDLNNGDTPFSIGRSLSTMHKDTVVKGSRVDFLAEQAATALLDLRSIKPTGRLDCGAYDHIDLPTKEAARSDIKALISEHGGVALDGYGYQSITQPKVSDPEL